MNCVMKGNVIDIAVRAKRIRAYVIRRHMKEHGFDRAICFSCGNATRALKSAKVDTLAIAPGADLAPTDRWFTISEIRDALPGYFDATPGHLPMDVMNRLAAAYRIAFADVFCSVTDFVVPTGSGETIICLKMAFPSVNFAAMWDNSSPATTFDDRAPLANIVRAVFPYVIKEGGRDAKN